MDRSTTIKRLRARERELRVLGLTGLSLFGSTARGEAGPESDVDLAATFDPEKRIGVFRYSAIVEEIEDMLGVPVDLVAEPARKARIQSAIERDRVRVF